MKKDLADNSYDSYLADKAKGRGQGATGAQRELRQRNTERKNANKGYAGWHFGLGEAPVKTKDKEEFKKALDQRGLVMRDDVKRTLK